MTCAVATCSRQRERRDWCNKHYRRWLRQGDPLVVLKVPNGSYVGCRVPDCETEHHSKGYCAIHVRRVDRYGDPLGGQLFRSVSKDPLERVRHYSSHQDSGCIYWTGSIQENGYGYLTFNGERTMAHVFAYRYLVGSYPRDLDLDHLCHNGDRLCPGGWDCMHRRCINVSHLAPSTRKENMKRARVRTGPEAA